MPAFWRFLQLYEAGQAAQHTHSVMNGGVWSPGTLPSESFQVKCSKLKTLFPLWVMINHLALGLLPNLHGKMLQLLN